MIPGEIALLEAARLQDGHRQRVAHDQHGGGAGGRREIERARLLGHFDVERNVAVPGERGFQVAGEGDDLDGKPFQRGQQVQQLLRLAGITQREDHVAVVDDADIAMQGVHAVEDDTGGAGAGEGGGNFLADVAGFADADDDDFSPALDGFHDGVDCVGKRAIELRAHGFERGDLNVKNFAGLREMLHPHRRCG